jgi:hypothetical protein
VEEVSVVHQARSLARRPQPDFALRNKKPSAEIILKKFIAPHILGHRKGRGEFRVY